MNLQSEHKVKAGKAADFRIKIEQQNVEQLNIVIFAGASGGTGSGMLTDIAFLIRHLINPKKQWGVIYFDDIVTGLEQISDDLKERQFDNMLNCIAELDFWQQPVNLSGKKLYSACWREPVRGGF
jgi:hypothetical protein